MILSEETKRRIDALFTDYDSTTGPGCVLGIAEGGELAYVRGYGMADIEGGVPVDSLTVFHLASVSKQFTATSIALLEEEGSLSLDDEVRTYLDWLPDHCQKLTLRRLVAMTNGLEDIYEVANLVMGIPEYDFFTKDEAIAMIRSSGRLAFEPGTKWSYGNTGYFLLARVVEKVSGLTFAHFAEKHIFGPLGMTDSFVRTDRALEIPHVARTYARERFLRFREKDAASLQGWGYVAERMELSGAGQVWSTLEDLALWERNYWHNVLGKGDPEFMQRISRPFALDDGTPTGYGYGQFVTTRKGYEAVYHEGGAPGINTVIYRIPDRRLSVIILANSSDFLCHILDKTGELIYESVADLVLGREKPKASTAEPADRKEPLPAAADTGTEGQNDAPTEGREEGRSGCSEYEGLYRCAGISTAYRVIAGEGCVELRNAVPSRNAMDLRFAAEDGDLFAASYPPVIDRRALRFLRDDTGKVRAFQFEGGPGGTFDWAFERVSG